MERVLVISDDQSLLQEIEALGQDHWFPVSFNDDIESSVAEKEKNLLIVDSNGKSIKEIVSKMQSFFNRDECVLILLTRNIPIKEIRKHQESKTPFNAYIEYPLPMDELIDQVTDLMSGFIEQENNNDDNKKKGEKGVEELTFVGVKTSISAVMAKGSIPTSASVSDMDDDFGEVEDLDGKKDISESTEELGEEEKEIIQAHSDDVSVADDRQGKHVQAQFDEAFGVIEYEDLDDISNKPVVDDSPPDVRIDLGIEEDIPVPEIKMEEDKVSADEIGIDDLLEGKTNVIALKPTKKEDNMSDQKKTDEADLDISFGVDEELGSEPAKAAKTTTSNELSDAAQGLSFDATETEEDGLLEGVSGAESKTNDAPAGGLDLNMDGGEEFELTGSGGGAGVSNEASNSEESEATVMVSSSDLSMGDDAGFEIENASSGKASKSKTVEAETEGDLDFSLDGAKTESDEVAPKEFDYKTGQIERPNSVDLASDDSLNMDENNEIEDDFNLDDAAIDEDEDEQKTKVLTSKKSNANEMMEDPGDDLFADNADDELSSIEDDEVTTQLSGRTSSNAATSNRNNEMIKTTIGRDMPDPYVDLSRIPTATIKEDELAGLLGTIKALRAEREGLISEIESLKEEKRGLQRENKGHKADLDEVRIELSIIRQRHEKEIDRYKNQLSVSEEKRAIIEQKWRQSQRDLDQIGEKVRVDVNQVKKREKELESKLELQSIDNESQVRARDQKILELKRKIDALEFNMENAGIREQQSKLEKNEVEDKLKQVMQTLRHSIQMVDEDGDIDLTDPRRPGNKKV